MTPRSRIISFYSYKGGVGRSMSLANLAILAAKSGRRTLAMDFDLEAPGLHRYFPSKHRSPEQLGVIDFFRELLSALEHEFPGEDSFDPEGDEGQAALEACRRIVVGLLGRQEFFRPSEHSNLTLMPAGRFGEDYAEQVRSFHWRGLFEDFAEVFGILREELAERYDEVFVDSRTGVTDAGSLTTVVLPDTLVVVFSPNEQSLGGGIEIARQASRMHDSLFKRKGATGPLEIVPLLSRVERGEVRERNKWVGDAAERYSKLFVDLLGWPDRRDDFVRYFDEVHVPQSSYYAFGEKLAVVDSKSKDLKERGERGFASLDEAYQRFYTLLRQGGIEDWLRAVPPRRIAGARALLVQFDALIQLGTGWDFESVDRVPDEASPQGWSDRLRNSATEATWQEATGLIDDGIRLALQHPGQGLHVFGMMPYQAAVLLGRRLDDLARGVPLSVYHFQNGQWLVFSSPSDTGEEDTVPVFEVTDVAMGVAHSANVLVAIEGMREIAFEPLEGLMRGLGDGTIVRVHQRTPAPLRPLRQTMQAVRELRRELARLQRQHPAGKFHFVSTAPAALLIEVGRMLSPTVYRAAVVYQYHPESASYSPAVDVIAVGA